MEFKKYKKITVGIELPIQQVTVHSKYSQITNQTVLLRKAYSQLYNDSIEDFNLAHLELNILFKKPVEFNSSEGPLKLLSVLLPLITVAITFSINVFKDNSNELIDVYLKMLLFSFFLSLLVGATILIPLIAASFKNKIDVLVSKHLIIIEDVLKEHSK
jgi:hypothetical protein